QRVEVLAEFGAVGERARRHGRVWMMTGNRQVGDEEVLALRERVDPLEDAPDRRGLVDAEARVDVPADRAGILQLVEATPFDHCAHPEIVETAGVKERRSVACIL